MSVDRIAKQKVKYNRYLIKKPMTLIIGARCKDGVVLAGDRRVLRGTEYSDEKKIVQSFPNFVVGASGVSGLMDKFLYEMNLYLNSPREKQLTWREFSYYFGLRPQSGQQVKLWFTVREIYGKNNTKKTYTGIQDIHNSGA